MKEEQAQHRISSSQIRHSAQINGLQEKKIANRPSETNNEERRTNLNEEQNKSETSNNKETKKSEISEENKEQSAEKKEQIPTSELAGSQNETTTETTYV